MNTPFTQSTTLRRSTFTALAALLPALALLPSACGSAPEAAPSAGASQGGPSVALQHLSGHLRPELASAPIRGRVPSATRLELTIGLPADLEAISRFVEGASNPESPTYRQYLTVEDFADRFGASREDYDAVVAWAQSKNLDVVTHRNRLFVRVSGAAEDVERAFNVHLSYALRPDGTQFHMPDAEPSVDLHVPIRYVSNLEDYVVWKSAAGSGPLAGTYTGADYRDAYAPGSGLTGAGQSVGIFAFSYLFVPGDIQTYNTTTGMNPPPVQNIGGPGTSNVQQLEVTLDIDSAQSMAPNAQVVVFNGTTDGILGAMADNPQILQLTSSFFPQNPPTDPNWALGFGELAAQGQSFFNCSGDGAAYGPTWTNMNDVRVQNFVTVVGGTNLSLTGSSYAGETAWYGSSGGIVANSNGGLAIPSYQVGINPNGIVSSANRNLPDVSALASNVDIFVNGAWSGAIGGTSVASPTWAGFMALANGRAAANGQPPIGFANPALYALARKPGAYGTLFNDITSGNNINSNKFGYDATTGYDLVTGIGTPKVGLINALARPARTYQGLDLSDVVVLGSDGNLWLEHGPFGTVPPPRQQIDGSVQTFQALDATDVVVLGNDGNLWYERGPFGSVVPPPRQQIDGSAQAFQALDASHVIVLGNDGNLWLEYGPFGISVPPIRSRIDYSVQAFQAIDLQHVVVLGNDGNLWLETAPFGQVVPPARQQIDANVKQFAPLDAQHVLVLGSDDNLWIEQAPFGSVPPSRQHVDGNVRSFQAIAGSEYSYVFVLGTNGNLWFEMAPFGTVPPARLQVDANVSTFRAIDGNDLLVLGTNGNLWLEQAPWGVSVPPARHQVDGNVEQ